MPDEIESGPAFEKRGLALARALHDPLGTQGSIMHGGRERDGLFIDHNDVHAYEFTTSRAKDKATYDASKLLDLLRDIGAKTEHSFKARTGWLVTLDEPTADQRAAVQLVTRHSHERIHIISANTLYQRIVNSELYLQARENSPFGSVFYSARNDSVNVAVNLVSPAGEQTSLKQLAERLGGGGRTLLIGNYGAGKSHSLRELYRLLRRNHFRSNKLSPFPIHINLRDSTGLKTPAEILRRHAEEIGFDNPSGLISAWRAGAAVLLLDGFDEVVPTRWLGGASDLRNVRWQALSPIRRLVEETPAESGIIVAGRAHYFSGESEMIQALGFKTLDLLEVPEFSDSELSEFLRQAKVEWSAPDWVPTRPLLLGYLVSLPADEMAAIAGAPDRATGWRHFFEAICDREAQIFSAVRPQTIRDILARVATLARSRASTVGPVDMRILTSAWVSVNGFQPDDEGRQLLLRLPGLAQQDASNAKDDRVFVDQDLADTAYAHDLASYAISPYDETHPLSELASWVNAASELGVEVAAAVLHAQRLDGGVLQAAIAARDKANSFDAVLADLIRTAGHLPGPILKLPPTPIISGVYFEALAVGSFASAGALTLRDCVIDRLDVSDVDNPAHVPHFKSCIVGLMDGASVVPPALKANFSDCEIERFSEATQTTAGIMQLAIDRDSRIALTVLKKVFSQRGSGRKESALSRGLSLNDRPSVQAVTNELISQGWLTRSSFGGTPLIVGVKNRRKDALRVLASPSDFKLK